MTSPRILFLDEPTSGLDSVASYEVMSYLKKIAKKNDVSRSRIWVVRLHVQLIIIASIHQPSTSTFNQFDKVYLLAKGNMCYGGPRKDIASYFSTLGFELPPATNPAEWILELVDTDFARDKANSAARLDRIIRGWQVKGPKPVSRSFLNTHSIRLDGTHRRTSLTAPFHLLHRNWLKSYRDVLPYWVRVAMYTCTSIRLNQSYCLAHRRRSCHPHGHMLAATRSFPERHTTTNNSDLFRRRLSQLYGCSLYSRIHRRSSDIL
jgi:hypothetical protein